MSEKERVYNIDDEEEWRRAHRRLKQGKETTIGADGVAITYKPVSDEEYWRYEHISAIKRFIYFFIPLSIITIFVSGGVATVVSLVVLGVGLGFGAWMGSGAYLFTLCSFAAKSNQFYFMMICGAIPWMTTLAILTGLGVAA